MTDIILAESNVGIQRKLERCLKEHHHDVRCMKDGHQTLEAILESPPDIVVLDIQMPKMNGLDLLKELKDRSPVTIPVLLLAKAKVNANTVGEALALGAGDYVQLPVNDDDLLRGIRVVLAKAEKMPSASLRPSVEVRLRELHDKRTGRIDASKIAEYLGLTQTVLAKTLGFNYSTVHKTPTSPALQDGLAPIKRSLEILDQVIGNPDSIRAWLNNQHPDLGMQTPIQTIIDGHASALRRILENAVLGIPT